MIKRISSLLRKNDLVIILPADNGFKVVVNLYDIFNKIFKKELIDIIIGGYLPGLLKKEKKYIKKLKKYTISIYKYYFANSSLTK